MWRGQTGVISFIVSVFDRTLPLYCLLPSLMLQEPPWEIIVTDASTDPGVQAIHRAAAEWVGARYLSTPGLDCYADAEKAIPLATGTWICLPNDDGYYVPGFAQTMRQAAREHGWDLVYCDLVYDPRLAGVYEVLRVVPKLMGIDKTCFIVRRSVMPPVFPGKDVNWKFCDGWLVEQLVKAGVRHGKAPGVMVVHN